MTRRQQLPLYPIALAILVIGALAVGVPASSLAIGLLVLACPSAAVVSTLPAAVPLGERRSSQLPQYTYEEE